MSSFGGRFRPQDDRFEDRRFSRVAERDRPEQRRWDRWEEEPLPGGGQLVRKYDEDDVYDRRGNRVGYDRVTEIDRYPPPRPRIQRRTSSLDRDSYADRNRWDRFDNRRPARRRGGSVERERWEEDIRYERPQRDRVRESSRDRHRTNIHIDIDDEHDDRYRRYERDPRADNMQISRRYERDEYDYDDRYRRPSIPYRQRPEREAEYEREIIRERERIPYEEPEPEPLPEPEPRPVAAGPVNVPVKVDIHFDQRALNEQIKEVREERPRTPPPIFEPPQEFEKVIEHERHVHRHSRSKHRSHSSRSRSSSTSSSSSSSSSSESVVSRKSHKSSKSTRSRRSRHEHHHHEHHDHHDHHDHDVVDEPWPRKGKTKISYKLVSKRAIVEKGYPYEDDGKLIVLQVALNKTQIDDLIALSEEIRRRDNIDIGPGPSVSTDIITIPADANATIDIIDERRHRARSVGGRSMYGRSRSRAREVDYLEVGDSASSFGDRREQLLIDDRPHRPDNEEIIRFPDQVRIERNRKGHLAWVKPA